MKTVTVEPAVGGFIVWVSLKLHSAATPKRYVATSLDEVAQILKEELKSE